MTGEFPHKKDGFVPVAYPVIYGKDKILSYAPDNKYEDYIYNPKGSDENSKYIT